MDQIPKMTPAQQIAFWADRLRGLAATGLEYANNPYDEERYKVIQKLSMEMLAYATGEPLESLLPLRLSLFSRMSPVVAGAAAVIDKDGRILLMRRSDDHKWAMPAGQMEVGETPAQGVVRETYEETGVRCTARALVGVYDSRRWDADRLQHVYKFTFFCEPQEGRAPEPFDRRETLEIGWFQENNLPEDLYPGHLQRIQDSYAARRGDFQAHFD